MKEIGKLIELLNEYKPQVHYLDKPKGVYDKKYGIGWYKREGDIGGWFSEEVIISKKFGFIKWLVENEKIETNNLNLRVFKSMFSNDGTVEISYEELILMLLAISDEPIRFLCEILKI